MGPPSHPTNTSATWLLLAASLSLGGCASITGSEQQNVTVVTKTKGGLPVTDASCKLENDKGSWRVNTPGSVIVMRSASDLLIACEKQGLPAGIGRAVSKANAGMFGNIIFGGAVGAVIDHSQGTAYDYPNYFQIEMGSTQVFGEPVTSSASD